MRWIERLSINLRLSNDCNKTIDDNDALGLNAEMPAKPTFTFVLPILIIYLCGVVSGIQDSSTKDSSPQQESTANAYKLSLLDQALKLAKDLPRDSMAREEILLANICHGDWDRVKTVLDELPFDQDFFTYSAVYAADADQFQIARKILDRTPLSIYKLESLISASYVAGVHDRLKFIHWVEDELRSNLGKQFNKKPLAPFGARKDPVMVKVDSTFIAQLTEQARFSFYIGRLISSGNHVQPDLGKGVQDSLMTEFIRFDHAKWMLRVKKSLPAAIAESEKINTYALRVRLNDSLLKQSTDEQLKTDAGKQLIQTCFQDFAHCRNDQPRELPDGDPEKWMSIMASGLLEFEANGFRWEKPRVVLDAAIKSGLIGDGREWMGRLKVTDLKKIWIEETADQMITSGKYELAFQWLMTIQQSEKILDGDQLARLYRQIMKTAAQKGELEFALQFLSDDRRDKLWISGFFLKEGDVDLAKGYRFTEVKKFRELLAKKEDDFSRGKFILDQAMGIGWVTGNDVPAHPLGDVIISEFAKLQDRTGLRKYLGRCLDSFTKPTPVTRELLLKISKQFFPKKTGPERLTSPEAMMVKEYELLAKMKSLDDEKDSAQISRIVMLLGSLPAYTEQDWYSIIPDEFARLGSKSGLEQILKSFEDSGSKVEVLVRCAAAFPPKSERYFTSHPHFSYRNSYSSGLRPGGLF